MEQTFWDRFNAQHFLTSEISLSMKSNISFCESLGYALYVALSANTHVNFLNVSD